jgi:hypothetical protein
MSSFISKNASSINGVEFSTEIPSTGESLLFDGYKYTPSNLSQVEVTHASWYIDPINGSDLNDGYTVATALKTGREFTRRVQGDNALWIGREYHIYVLNDILGSNNDWLYIGGFRTRTANIFVHGSATPGTGKTVLYSGTISYYTIPDKTAANGGIRGTITDSGVPTGTWAGAGYISTDGAGNKRIRITSGAHAGTVVWPQKDLGGGKVAISQMTKPTVFTGPITRLHFYPDFAALDGYRTFVVESLTRVELLYDAIKQIDDGSMNAWTCTLHVDSLQLNYFIAGGIGFGVILYGCCSLKPNSGGASNRGTIYYCCCHSRGGVFKTDTTINVNSCHVTNTFFPYNGGALVIDGDTIAQGVPLLSLDGQAAGTAHIGSVASFDSITDGIIIGNGSLIISASNWYSYYNKACVWGSGAVCAGIAIRAGGKFIYESRYSALAPNIFGAVNQDFKLNGAYTARAWDNNTSAYTTARNCTWANLAAPIASGGFGGQAIDPATNAIVALNIL